MKADLGYLQICQLSSLPPKGTWQGNARGHHKITAATLLLLDGRTARKGGRKRRKSWGVGTGSAYAYEHYEDDGLPRRRSPPKIEVGLSNTVQYWLLLSFVREDLSNIYNSVASVTGFCIRCARIMCRIWAKTYEGKKGTGILCGRGQWSQWYSKGTWHFDSFPLSSSMLCLNKVSCSNYQRRLLWDHR